MTLQPPSPPEAPACSSTSPSPSPTRPPITLLQPSQRKPATRSAKLFRVVRSVFRSFPILTPACRLNTATLPRGPGHHHHDGHIRGSTRTTGTLFGHRKGRITLSVQDNPRSVPILLLELAIPTAKFMQEMGSGLLRIALECEKKKKTADNKTTTKLADEPIWTAFINGRKIGFAVRRDPTDADLSVMQMLHAVSMGAGVLPGDMTDPVEGELTYMRAHFERVVGSKDSETLYMLNPDANTGPELSIFLVRI